MGNAVSTRQKTWLEATEKRINFTSHVLGSIKSVKFLGLTEFIKQSITGLRIEELEISKKFRRIQTVRVCMSTLACKSLNTGNLIEHTGIRLTIAFSKSSDNYCTVCYFCNLCFGCEGARV